jgi:amidohydrolase
MMMRGGFVMALTLLAGSVAAGGPVGDLIEKELPSLVATYQKLHASPELSGHEEKTAALLAAELRELGFEVTERIGIYESGAFTGHGLAAVLRNGAGPTVLVRADLDALPITEETGLPWASRVRVKAEDGQEVGVMHACGHDIHMASFLGTARVMMQTRDRWSGTLLLIGQPAEELGLGSRAMMADPKFATLPKPDVVLALHDTPQLAAGQVGVTEGFITASVDSVDVTVRGVGGHGAVPHATRDPIVLASQIVLALQTIVSREISPLDPAVVTVGSIHGGTKHNIIPPDVKLQLTVRTYKDEVRNAIIAAIERIAVNTALAAGVPPELAPTVTVTGEGTRSMWNDPELTRRLRAVWERELGVASVSAMEPSMVGEDFTYFAGANRETPLKMFWLGVVSPELMEKSRREGVAIPGLHSSRFAPDAEPAIRTGVRAMTAALYELMRPE